jgi:hypothetical protein
MSKNFQSTHAHVQKPVPHETWEMFVWSLQRVFCFPCFWTERSADRADQLNGPPRPLRCSQSLVQALSDCGENEMVPHHAWTTSVVADEEAQIPRVLVNHSPNTMVHWTTLSSGASSCLNHTCCHWLRGISSKSTGKSFTKHDGPVNHFVKWCLIMPEPHVLSLIKWHKFQEYWYIIHQTRWSTEPLYQVVPHHAWTTCVVTD